MKQNKPLCMVLLSIFHLAWLPEVTHANWVDEYVSETDQILSVWSTDRVNEEFSPYKLLPKHSSNTWEYRFQETINGVTNIDQEVSAAVGELENLGNLCIRPLIFGDGLLKLYLANYDDRLVFYGLRTSINNQATAFFTQKGGSLGASSGLVLASSSQSVSQLSLDSEGTFAVLIDGEEFEAQWRVGNIQINVNSNAEVFDGVVNGSAMNGVSPANVYQVNFRLFLGPCEIEGGCYAGDYTLEFLPGLGLKRLVLRGDNEDFGGQYEQEYSLLESPESSFVLQEQENRYMFESCLGDEQAFSNSSLGFMHYGFNILMLFVVVCRVPARWEPGSKLRSLLKHWLY